MYVPRVTSSAHSNILEDASMHIYTKVLPYVYCLNNPITGEFYIGYREKNTEPSHLDFPKYKTSAPKVKASFDQFTWHIVAEFFEGNDAYDFEQQLIFENWTNPLLLNRSCFHGSKRFKFNGGSKPGRKLPSRYGTKNNMYGKTHTEETKLNSSMRMNNLTAIGKNPFQNPDFIKENAIKSKTRQLEKIQSGMHQFLTEEFLVEQSIRTAQSNTNRNSRPNVLELAELNKIYKIKLGSGWRLKSDDWINSKIKEFTLSS